MDAQVERKSPESGWILPDGRLVYCLPHHHLQRARELECMVHDPPRLGWIKTHFVGWSNWVTIWRQPSQQQVDTLADWADTYHAKHGGAIVMMQMIDAWTHHPKVGR